MTEQEEDLLAELLDLPEADSTNAAPADNIAAQRFTSAGQPLLTRRDEQALLTAANRVGTPTLASQNLDLARRDSAGSFGSEISSLVRRYPIPTLLAGIGIGYLLTRRRR